MVDINRASEEELCKQCGIDTALARRILRYRPVPNMDALEKAPGMDVLTVLKMRHLGCSVVKKE